MKLEIGKTKIVDIIDDSGGKYPRVTLILDDGGYQGKRYELGVEFFGQVLDELRGLPEVGDSFEGECSVSTRRSNGRPFTSVSARKGKWQIIPGRKQPGHNAPGGPIDDDVPFAPVKDTW